MDNDHQSPQDDKWTMPESSRVASNPVVHPTQINQAEQTNNGSAPPQVSSQNHSSFGESLIAPQEPSSALSSPQLNKPTHHIYGHQKKRSGIGMRLTFALFGLLLIGGVGYLGMSLINTGQQKIASTLEVAWGDPIYEGNGSDIVEIVKPTSAFVCPDDYTQEGSGGTATCTKTETKTVSPVIYSCPSGYEKSGSGSSVQCSKIVGGTEMSVAATSAYSCASGYTKSGSGASTKCTKTETANLTKTYSCQTGYLKTGEGDTLRCVKSDSVEGTVRGSCPSGYVTSGSGVSTTCKQTINASSSTTYDCPASYGNRSGTTCYSNSSYTAIKTYSCPSGLGYVQTSTIFCVKTITGTCRSGYVKVSTACYQVWTPANGICGGAGVTYYSYSPNRCRSTNPAGTEGVNPPGACPYSNDTRTGNTLQVTCKRDATPNFLCPSGTIAYSGSGSGLVCKYKANAISSTSYSCPSGYTRSGTTCSRTTTATLSCDSGFAKSETGSATKCLKISMDTKAPIVSTTCPNSFSKSGGKCTKTLTIAGTVAHVCESGYALSGNQCTKIVGGQLETTQPNKTYACPADYDKSGEGANMKCTKVVTDTKKIQSEYVCQDGWFKREVGKSVDCARTASGKKPSTEQKQQSSLRYTLFCAKLKALNTVL